MNQISKIKFSINNSHLLNFSNSGSKSTGKVENVNKIIDNIKQIKNPLNIFDTITDDISAGPLGGYQEININDYSVEDSESFVSNILVNLPENTSITVIIDGKKHKVTRKELEEYQKNSTTIDGETGAKKQMTLKNFLYRKHQDWFFSSFSNTYGCNQRGIQSLFMYELDGKEYTYKEYKKYCSECEKKGIPVPKFTKRVNNGEYFRLKNKLIERGFSQEDADATLQIINNGPGICTYATTVNSIIASYIGREEEFEKKFGFPMYIEENGERKLNTNELLLDLYIYVNSEENGGFMFSKDHKLFFDKNKSTYGDSLEQKYLRTTGVIKDERGKLVAIPQVSPALTKYLKSKNIDYNGSFIYDSTKQKLDSKEFKQLMDVLRREMEKGKTFDIGISGAKGYNPIHMYNTTPGGEDYFTEKGTGHSVYITKIGKDCLYVSSWGEEYKMPFKDLTNNSHYYIYSSTIK